MKYFGLVTALFLPWVFGFIWLRVFWMEGTVVKRSLFSTITPTLVAQLGYGYFLGVFSVTVVMRIWDSAGLKQSFLGLSLLITALTLVGVIVLRKRRVKASFDQELNFSGSGGGLLIKAACIVLFLLIAIHLLGTLLEIIYRPLYPWDAWVNWAPKARVWFENSWLVPHVGPNEWLKSPGPDSAYTLGNRVASHYPPSVPLIQLWITLGLGEWDDSLINLPWFFCLVSLVTGFYGQAGRLGLPPLVSLLFIYLLCSMPYIMTHAALAGYAELWLATAYGLAAMALVHWVDSRDRRQGILALILAIVCTQIKLPGIVWALTFAPAIVVVMTPVRWQLRIVIVFVMAIATFIYSGGFEIKMPGNMELVLTPERMAVPGFRETVIQYHPVWEAFLQNEFVFSSWHLFWYIWWPSIITLTILEPRSRKKAALLTLVATSILFIFGLFFFTRYYKEALDYTTINRAMLHMVPMLVFVAMTLAVGRLRRLYRY